MSAALTVTVEALVRAPGVVDLVDAAAAPIRAEVEQLRHLVGAIEGAVGMLARGEPVPDLPPVQTHFEHFWACRVCGRRIGVIDRAEDVLYVKYKDLYLRFHVGLNGWIETQCLYCGATNRADYAPG